MGFSISWLAIKTDKLDQICDLAEISPTKESDEYFESALAGSAMKNGWYLFQANGCDHPIISDASLSKISTLGETIACSVEEHVMFSGARCWKDGVQQWSITHNADDGLVDLKTEGTLPAHFESVKSHYLAEHQAELAEVEDEDDVGVDYIFEIPLVVAEQICGYKHDVVMSDWVPPGPVVFELFGAGKSTGESKSKWKLW